MLILPRYTHRFLFQPFHYSFTNSLISDNLKIMRKRKNKQSKACLSNIFAKCCNAYGPHGLKSINVINYLENFRCSENVCTKKNVPSAINEPSLFDLFSMCVCVCSETKIRLFPRDKKVHTRPHFPLVFERSMLFEGPTSISFHRHTSHSDIKRISLRIIQHSTSKNHYRKKFSRFL